MCFMILGASLDASDETIENRCDPEEVRREELHATRDSLRDDSLRGVDGRYQMQAI